MKNVLFLLLVCGLNSATLALEPSQINLPDKLSPEQLAAAEDEYKLWFNQLNAHLLSSTDTYEQSMGLAAILNGTLRELRQQKDQSKTDELLAQQVQLMNAIIHQPNLTAETMDLLLTWCFKEAIIAQCDHDALLDKHLQQFPDNINAYLQPLQLAIKAKNQALVDKIIDLMGQSRYSQATQFITESFNQAIDDYIDKNPIPDSAIAAFKDDQALLAGLADPISANLDQRIKDYFPASIKLSYVYLLEVPDAKPVYQLCKSRRDLFNHCLKITQTLINASNTIQFKGLGYVILMGMHESMGKQQLFKTVQVKQAKYKATVQCLTEATQTAQFMDNFLDPKYQEINLLPIDEFKKLELMANYVYQREKANNPKHRDPKGCYHSKPSA